MADWDTPRIYALLEPILKQKGLQLQRIYTNQDAARIFGVSVRTIQDWCRDGKLVSRDLPGRGRFLSDDFELFLQESLRPAHAPNRDSL
jgi:Helix-turn-helix domain